MARCEQGYLCDVCGQDVEAMTDSDLYLRYILGEVPPDRLQATPERHIRCNPTLAQFIVDSQFPPIHCVGHFAKEQLDPSHVREEEERVTRAWRRLQVVAAAAVPIPEYPLPEVRRGWGR